MRVSYVFRWISVLAWTVGFSLQAAAGGPTPLAQMLADSTPAPFCNAMPDDIAASQLTRYTVEGTVTAHSGAFEKSYGNPGFQLSDGTAGVFVLTDRNLDFEDGDRARVTGWPCVQFGTRALGQTVVVELDDDDRTPFSPRQIGQLERRPEIVGSPDVTNNWCNCSTPVSWTEGRVITVRGKAVADLQQDGVFGYKLFLDDGTGVGQVFIDALSGIDAEELEEDLLQEGKDLCVTGVVGRFAGVGFELLPRSDDDFSKARRRRDGPCRD